MEGGMRLVGALVMAVVLAGCPASILEQYEAAKTEALAVPAPVSGTSWTPDAVLHLSPELIDQLVTTSIEIQGAMKETYEVETGVVGITARISTDLHVDSLTVESSKRCEGCLAIDATLAGTVDWQASGTRGDSPMTVRVAFDADFSGVEDEGGVFTMTAMPRDLRKVELTVERASGLIQPVLEGKFRKYLEESLFAEAEPLEIASFGSADLPLRAMRVVNEPRCVGVAMLTRAANPGSVELKPGKIADGWQLDLAEQSLVSLARKASFEAGPVSHDVVIDVTGLSFGAGDFELGLRLWRPVGKGWWRDYTATGTFAVRAGDIAMNPTGVAEVGQSEGAALVDPLAAIGEGVIVRAIRDGITTAIPTGFTATSAGMYTNTSVTSAMGAQGVLTVKGSMTVKKGKPKPKKPKAAPAPAPAPKGMPRPR